jgi:hypothetical protein
MKKKKERIPQVKFRKDIHVHLKEIRDKQRRVKMNCKECKADDCTDCKFIEEEQKEIDKLDSKQEVTVLDT